MQNASTRVVLQLAGALLLCACSDRHEHADKAVAVDDSEVFDGGRDPFGSEAAASAATGDMPADADAGVKCANFSLTIVGPFVQVVGDEATFSGHAHDDQNHEFELSWSASSGELSDKTGPRTRHKCSEPGISTISMTATLAAVCSSALAHVVTCLKPSP